jgi:hypothetical protein
MNLENVSKAAEVRVRRFAMAITLVASIAIAIMYFSPSGQAQLRVSSPAPPDVITMVPRLAVGHLQW